MGSKPSGIERFIAPSLGKIGEELGSIHSAIDSLTARMAEMEERFSNLEGDCRKLETRMDKKGEAPPPETQLLITNIGEMEQRDRDEIDTLKRFMDVAQRRLAILEAKMKELGQ
ncbi:MAG: hypothetical protein KGI33_02085 [Thaumarchaeota archaeon]|nr:hypothetical protein [Nitrososphaerota archaeon]